MPDSGGMEALLRSRRILLMLGVALYAGLFLFTYQQWLSPVFGYLGFTYSEPQAIYLALAWVLCLAPCLWMPIDITRPSMLVYWILYLVVYVPTMFVPFLVRLRPPEEVSALVATLALGNYILGLSYRLPLLRLSNRQIPPRLFWILLAISTSLMIFAVVLVFRGKMHLVSMEDIYGQRAEAKAIAKGGFIGYPMSLLQGMIAPFFMTFGLVKRKYWLYGVGVAIQVLIYACLASKSALASVIFSVAFYLLLRLSQRGFGLTLSWSLAGLMGGLAIATSGKASTIAGLVSKLASVVLLRTIGIPGLLAAQYQSFFTNHPLTYLSHVNVVNWFITYPYDQSLGVTVGYYFSGDVDLNANANMWMTDGVAAFGLPGILFVSVLCALIFWMVDSASQRHSVLFGASTLTFAALSLANVSLFTALISGGLFPLMVMLMVMPSVTLPEGPSWVGARFPFLRWRA
ncbi:MAG TPA: hypothetical protein VJ600_09305 [Holophagaceae bacterium]|nr:hypothetical protein [Holophagaceae bacterium]